MNASTFVLGEGGELSAFDHSIIETLEMISNNCIPQDENYPLRMRISFLHDELELSLARREGDEKRDEIFQRLMDCHAKVFANSKAREVGDA